MGINGNCRIVRRILQQGFLLEAKSFCEEVSMNINEYTRSLVSRYIELSFQCKLQREIVGFLESLKPGANMKFEDCILLLTDKLKMKRKQFSEQCFAFKLNDRLVSYRPHYENDKPVDYLQDGTPVYVFALLFSDVEANDWVLLNK